MEGVQTPLHAVQDVGKSRGGIWLGTIYLYEDPLFSYQADFSHPSGIAKGEPGRARARPKHHVRATHVTQSRAKHTRERR